MMLAAIFKHGVTSYESPYTCISLYSTYMIIFHCLKVQLKENSILDGFDQLKTYY